MSKQEEKQVMTVADLRKELAEAKRSHKMGELKNTARLRELRVEIARSLTNERADKKVEEK
jgi:ribosomal protein L29